ncbi:MAG: T9SS type A sorting domain-containing protein [Saprospiraceae bacterium]|nr:T9SS type A sorting domain-containing protein [Saprospiraceae bacterium]
MKKIFPLAILIIVTNSIFAQTNVRAWYADGQVWVVWEVSNPLPETYAVYAKPTVFNNTDNATLVGRLFKEEFGPAALREQVDSSATYRIPNGNGGIYQLEANEALFVATPHEAGTLFFAVVAWDEKNVTPGVNITPSAVPFQYNPANDPVECHLQKTFISPFNATYRCLAFYMWADGRQNQWENRPDFPVMANAAKNGMPSLFLVSVPMDLDTSQPFPLTVWLHGGGGTARQSLAGSRQDIHLNPKKGILLAHNDDLFCYLLTFYSGFESNSKHFGWRKNYDPFTGNPPTDVDTIVNYTQRRYIWIDQWLMRRFNIDPARINVNGHSMGSRGTTILAKTFPNHYATATVLNNGFQDDDPPSLTDVVYGPSALSFPTNLTGYDGQTIPFNKVMNLEFRLSMERDLPLIRSFHGKNDVVGGNEWDAYVVEQYRTTDSLGWGAQLYWSERSHGPDTGPDYDDHWINGNAATEQTVVDDVAYEEKTFRSDVSFPAFFNHRLDPQNNDPGDGTPGTGAAGVGDDWGTWGGYHRWDWDNITDQAGSWSAIAWLESEAVFDHDNCPNNFLTADMAIRRPQLFKPATGTTIYWRVRDFNTNQILQSGSTAVQDDDLTVIPQIKVFKQDLRKVRIEVSTQQVATWEPEKSTLEIRLSPNPSIGASMLSIYSDKEQQATLRISSVSGELYMVKKQLIPGENRIPLIEFGQLPPGFYFIEIETAMQRNTIRWVKN